MPDDTDKRDIVAEEATYISQANHQLEGKQATLDIVSYIPALREIAGRDAVCDDQADELNEAIVALRQAGDAIWPGDEGVPPPEELAAWPGDDSGRAVTHYQREEYRPVIQHNIADIHRTWELGELVRTYVAGSGVSTKPL